MVNRTGSMDGDTRIGVFICHCGGNISDVVDVARVAETVGDLPDVVFSTTHQFMCSDPGQALVEEKIHEFQLNRIIVAACSPTLHLLTFRRALERAGLNQFLLEHVNIREHVSWVVEDREQATLKAIRLVSAAVGRIRHLVPLNKRRIPIHPTALVIGGGVAGLVAARDLLKRGMRVTLLEQSPFLGGRAAQ
ncbi:CoB--CoM heterodisulfide reductase iron-sulfur subunit A family protein, partial [bacterium]|nr:CoB--CoM heterodisulfide reductase iron-sulfur subunit A family protein [candidate division CSSED10-310 bacterium]